MEPSTESAAPASTPAASTAEPAAVAQTEPTTDTSPDAKRAKKDAIIRSVRAATKAAAEPAQVAAVEAAPKPVAPKVETTAASAAPAVDPGLTTRLAALEAELNETKTKLTEREKVRAAPTDVAGILDLMQENPDMTIEKISELYLARQDNPAHKELSAAEKRLKAIEDKIADGERIQKERETQTAAAAQAEAGRKDMRAILDADKARWPRLTRDERNATEALSEAEGKAGDRARALIKAGGKFTEDVAKQMVSEALDEIEKDRADRATRYAMPDIPARRTLTATAGSNGTIPQPKPESEPQTKDQKRQAILARVRAGQPKTTA